MIDPYYGDLLVSPFPLECSLNYCSHKCAYCFANLNKPGRAADMPKILRLLGDFQNRKTLTAQLLQRRYPILLSNRVDPFANSNYKLTLPLLSLFRDLDIPVAFQTKGGRGLDDALALIKPSSFYISIATLDDDIRRKVEPGAPSIQSRFDLVRQLAAIGHAVTVGVNPLTPEWVPDIAAMMHEIKAAGASGVWLDVLHLNRDQVSALSPRERVALSEPVIARAQKRTIVPEMQSHYLSAHRIAAAHGLATYSGQHPAPTQFFTASRALYPNTFPLASDFITHCHATKKAGDDIWFSDWFDFFAPSLPQLDHGARLVDYIGATCSRSIKKTHTLDIQNWKDLLAVIWRDSRHPACPIRGYAFDPIDDKDGLCVVDEYDLPVIKFTGKMAPDFDEISDLKGGDKK